MIDEALFNRMVTQSSLIIAALQDKHGQSLPNAMLGVASAHISLAVTHLLMVGFDQAKIKEIIIESMEVYFAAATDQRHDHGGDGGPSPG